MGSIQQNGNLTEPYYDIKGIPLRDGKIPCRIECNIWCKDAVNSIQVSLFMRALQKMYDRPWTDPLSFYQIASIHGYPGFEWNNGGPPPFYPPGSEDPTYVYCTHNSSLFPTWHRPYMLLFEQRLHQLMLEAINKDMTFPNEGERERWEAQAYEWRLPYWDWGLPFGKGEQGWYGPAATERANPLSRYQCKNEDGNLMLMGTLPKPFSLPDDVYTGTDPILKWSKCSGISRWGITDLNIPQNQAEGINDWNLGNKAIAQHAFYNKNKDGNPKPGDDLRKHTVSDLVYRLLDPKSKFSWKAFCTTRYAKTNADKWEDYINIEMIHNNLHNFIGGLTYKTGLGHMSDVPVAAFDPVFYFHHANVDYQFALWQKLNPKEKDSQAWYNPGIDDASGNTGLTPFHRKDERDGRWKLWTPDDCYDTTKLGYDYDVLQKQDRETDEELRARIIASLDRYSITDKVMLHAAQTQPQKLGIMSATSLTTTQAEGHMFPDYIATVLYDRYALNGAPYTIHFFFGKVDDETINKSPLGAEYLEEHVGSLYNFSAAQNFDKDTCANCIRQTEEGAMSTALVPLTVPLYSLAASESDRLDTISDDEATAFLKAALTWKATDIKGEVVPWETLNLRRTKVMVLRGTARHFHAENEVSQFSNYQPLANVTDGKACGAKADEYADPVTAIFSSERRTEL